MALNAGVYLAVALQKAQAVIRSVMVGPRNLEAEEFWKRQFQKNAVSTPTYTVFTEADTLEEEFMRDWIDKWRDDFPYFYNSGCGCCVNIYEFDAPEEALAELPPELIQPYKAPVVIDHTIYRLTLLEVGPNRGKVFAVLRRTHGLSPVKTKELMDSGPVEVAVGPAAAMLGINEELETAQATVRLEIVHPAKNPISSKSRRG